MFNLPTWLLCVGCIVGLIVAISYCGTVSYLYQKWVVNCQSLPCMVATGAAALVAAPFYTVQYGLYWFDQYTNPLAPVSVTTTYLSER